MLFLGFVVSQFKVLIAFLLSLFRRSPKPIWLIGERGGLGIDDMGDSLCAYLLKHRPDIDVRFVTRVAHMGLLPPEVRAHTLPHGSIRQLVCLCRAQVVIFTDCFEDVAPFWRLSVFRRGLNRNMLAVFLNHGVTALNRTFGCHDYATMVRRGDRVNLVTVCSEQEKSFMVEGFGHPTENIVVTGVPRLDNLPLFSRPSVEAARTILFVPTSRRPLRKVSRREFLASHYHQEIMLFLQSPSLQHLLVSQGATLKVVLHHTIAKYKDAFKSVETASISVTDMVSESVQQLLISADLLITDYSSVAFDFVYMNRPVVFFQFDRAYFEAHHGAPFVDFDTELPGVVVTTALEAEKAVQCAIDRNWQIDDQSRAKVGAFFAFHDHQNCERIVAAIEARLGAEPTPIMHRASAIQA